CTIQRLNSLETDEHEKIKKYFHIPEINFIDSHLTYQQITNLYYTHHVSIQVSKHEGLGLCFYEAISSGTPVISLDTPPHNEIIHDGVNGWLIPCRYEKMTDNKSPLFDSAYFDSVDLCDKIIEIVNQGMIPGIINSLKR